MLPLDVHQDLLHRRQDQAFINGKVEQKKERDHQELHCLGLVWNFPRLFLARFQKVWFSVLFHNVSHYLELKKLL